MSYLTNILGILALIFLVAALASGLVERAPVSFPMIFLGLGLLVGEHGLGLVKVGLHDPILETVATLSLSFVLFLDAVNLRLEDIRKAWRVPVLALGPGTLLTMAMITVAAYFLLGFPFLQSLLLGAILSSVDPVLLRDVARDERIPRSIRDSLTTEAGANDMIVLPVVLLLQAVAQNQGETTGGWLVFLARLFLLGPIAGFVIAAIAAKLIQWVRSRTPINREYRALYGIGVLFAAYFTGTSLGSSGFLAVFAAGLGTALFDDDLCDCFLEYGETTAEMAMLLAFLLFGALLSTLLGEVALLPALVLAVVTLVVIRPVAIGIVLRHVLVSRHARLFIGWFGPRGLSSLLFGLLLVAGGVPGAEQVLAAAGVVVFVSIVLHGVSAAPLAAHYSRVVAKETLPEEREATATGLFTHHPSIVPRITPEQLADRLNSPNQPLVLDVRSRSSYGHEMDQIPGSIRVLPDQVREWADGRPKDREMVAYCT
jgi:NhaP-type Na+/H+ or K+/H+ antiporter